MTDTERNSRLHGATAGRDLKRYDVLTDLVEVGDSTDKVNRTVAEPIMAGQQLEVRDDGRIYAAAPVEPDRTG